MVADSPPNNPAEFGSATEFTVRTFGAPTSVSAGVSANTGYGETDVTWRLDFWGGPLYSNSTSLSGSSATGSNVRPPEELAELHPETMTNQERQALQIEKIKPRQFGRRADQLNIEDKRLDRWKQNGDPVYLIHNPPVNVTRR